ncbi:peptidase S8/S53 domain-containing protein [Leptodontidium sp. MPI-SDFR-AT-0119]|nr:peptidase S8/S53 domain-containing protein [Leptodontidium sp. MPI-SDFR-AT-0119]
MRLSFIASIFLVGGCAVQAATVKKTSGFFLQPIKTEKESLMSKPTFWTGAYIIQLKPGSGLVRRGQDEHSLFRKRASDIDYSTRQEFKNPDLFFGLSIQVKDDANDITIQAIPNVMKVCGKGVIAVGSVPNNHYPAVYGGKDSRGRSFKYSGDPWPVQAPATGLVVYDFLKLAGGTSSPEGCNFDAWWAADDTVVDKDNSIIALPYGGGCSWATKSWLQVYVDFATDANDIFDKEYNSVDPFPPYYGITLNEVNGRTLLGGLSPSKPKLCKLYFSSDVFESHTQLTAGMMSNFSSWGPTPDTLVIKPQISAPGGSVLATWPLEGTGYAVLSGTSMATPYVAGALALLKYKFPHASVQKLREILPSTTSNVPYVCDKSHRSSIAQQGGGLINVCNAVHFESSVTPSKLNLGDLDQFKPREIRRENNSGRSKTYIISHEPAGDTNLLPYLYRNTAPVDGVSALPGLYASYATVKFSSTSITIGAGQSANFTATFQPPNRHRRQFLARPYSRFKADYIDATSNTGEKLPELFYFDEEFAQRTVTDIETFDFGLSVPRSGYGLWADSERNMRPTAYLYYLEGVAYDYGEVPLGALPEGDYRTLLRVLRWGGDGEKEEGYQSWLSPVIRVKKTL